MENMEKLGLSKLCLVLQSPPRRGLNGAWRRPARSGHSGRDPLPGGFEVEQPSDRKNTCGFTRESIGLRSWA